MVACPRLSASPVLKHEIFLYRIASFILHKVWTNAQCIKSCKYNILKHKSFTTFPLFAWILLNTRVRQWGFRSYSTYIHTHTQPGLCEYFGTTSFLLPPCMIIICVASVFLGDIYVWYHVCLLIIIYHCACHAQTAMMMEIASIQRHLFSMYAWRVCLQYMMWKSVTDEMTPKCKKNICFSIYSSQA